jgi:hypothetical protein
VTAVPADFPVLLQDFFQRRLLTERGVSIHTITSYRDTFELLLRYAQQRTGRTPSALTLDDLDAPLILDFLDHLESDRGNSPRTRNLRLTAIRPAYPSSSVCWRSLPRGSTGPRWSSSPARRSPHCWPPRTPAPGAADATPHCSLCSTTAAHASPKPPG